MKNETEVAQKDNEIAPSLKDVIVEMTGRARLSKMLLGVSDVRYLTIGIPEIITDQYIYFSDAWEVGKTGKLGGVPDEAERIAPGGKVIMTQSIISIDMVRSPK